MKIDGSGQRKTPRGLWIPRTPGARDEVVGGMESELVPTQPSQTYPATATIGKSRQLRNETGRKHKEAGRKVISAKKFGFIEQTTKHKRDRLKSPFSRPLLCFVVCSIKPNFLAEITFLPASLCFRPVYFADFRICRLWRRQWW